jgi:hypothetical protein
MRYKVDGWWMQRAEKSRIIPGSFLDDRDAERMVTLWHYPPSALPQDCQVSATLNETHLRATTSGMEATMRLVFSTTLTVDVPPNDDELRKAFIELVCQSARQVYGPAAMLAKTRPTMNLTETSREGMKQLPLLEDATPES